MSHLEVSYLVDPGADGVGFGVNMFNGPVTGGELAFAVEREGLAQVAEFVADHVKEIGHRYQSSVSYHLQGLGVDSGALAEIDQMVFVRLHPEVLQ